MAHYAYYIYGNFYVDDDKKYTEDELKDMAIDAMSRHRPDSVEFYKIDKEGNYD